MYTPTVMPDAESLKGALQKGIDLSWNENMTRDIEEMSFTKLVETDSSSTFEKKIEIGEGTKFNWDKVENNSQPLEAQIGTSRSTSISPDKRNPMITIEAELMERMSDPTTELPILFGDYMAEAMEQSREKMETEFWTLFNNGFLLISDPDVTLTIDNLPLFDGSHVYASFDGETFSSRLTGDPVLDDDSLRSVIKEAGSYKRPDGSFAKRNFDTLVCGTGSDTYFAAQQILNGTIFPQITDNVNVFASSVVAGKIYKKGADGIIDTPHITDKRYAFFDSTARRRSILLKLYKSPKVNKAGFDHKGNYVVSLIAWWTFSTQGYPVDWIASKPA